MNKPANPQKERNYGIDLLRLFAMYLVVVLHVLGQGGVLSASTGARGAVAWFFEVFAYCAVDIFAMISGFVSYREEEKPYKYTKYLAFWFPVWFYSFFIVLIGSFLRPDVPVSLTGYIFAFLPVASGRYWYVCAYTGLFFVIPLINRALRHTDEKSLGRLAGLFFAVFSVYACIASYYYDVFSLDGGYSFVWLVLMYIAGVYIKKCRLAERVSAIKLFILLIISVVFTFIASEISPALSRILVTYVSPTVLVPAVALLILFAKMKISPKFAKVITFLSPAAFGVYIIHTNPWIWDNYFKSAFTRVAYLPVYLLPLGILGAALAVFAVCLAVERTRIFLFGITGLDRFIGFIMKKIDALTQPASEH